MSVEKNKVTVDIYGQQYTIVGEESTEHLHKVATAVNEKMREIQSMNHSLETAKLAVLTAVNSVHEYYKLLEKSEALEEELKQYRK